MSGWTGRRAVVGVLAFGPLLAGCGFRPMYAAAPDGAPGPAAEGLAAINVGIIPERTGQLLRQALQARLERGGAGIAHRYDLVVSWGIGGEGIGIRSDNSTTRIRYTGTATYTLLAEDPTRTTLTTGTARAIDGLNVLDQQYFAMDLETETIQRRLAEAVAEQITTQLAAFFAKRAQSAG